LRLLHCLVVEEELALRHEAAARGGVPHHRPTHPPSCTSPRRISSCSTSKRRKSDLSTNGPALGVFQKQKKIKIVQIQFINDPPKEGPVHMSNVF
jgi:hypothetical protein